MNYLYFFLVNILLITCINYVQHKFNFLIDIRLKHKIKNTKKIPLSGGIYILISFLLLKYVFGIKIPDYLVFTISLFFLLGYFSDTKPHFIPILRLFLQLILIVILILLCDLHIDQSKIFFIDKFLKYNLFNLLFTSICIIVLLNGSNFIDGVNTNLIGYCIIVLFFLSKFEYPIDINFILLTLLTFYLFNSFGKCFLGDNGVYVLSILISYFVINIVNFNSINPIFAINLLWYPAFENLFSIIRRYVSDYKVDKADKKHLHSILYLMLSKNKIFYKYSNSMTGLIINFYNFFSIMLSYNYMNNNQILLTILIINIITYLFAHFKLLNILSNRFVSKK